MRGALSATEAKHIGDALSRGVWPGGGPLHDGSDFDSEGKIDDTAQHPAMPLVGTNRAEVVRRKDIAQVGWAVAETRRRAVIADRARKDVTGVEGEVVAQPFAIGEV